MGDLFINLLYYTIKYSTPLLLCSIGGVFVQKAGTMNFAFEAAINTSCFASVVFSVITGRPVWGIISAVLSCLLINAIFGMFVIKFNANAIIVGLSLNILMMAVPPYLLQAFFNSRGLLMATDIIDVTAFTLDIPVLRNIPVIGAVLNNQTVLTWLTYLIIIILSVVFYKTKYGIYVQVTGENGEAAEAVGVKTNHIKWAALAISAVCCALAGLNLTFEQVGSYSLNMSASRGLICLSAIECGRRLPGRACLFSVLFGFAKALQLVISAYLSPDISLVMDIVPYMAVILVFIFAEIPEAKKNTMRVFKDN